MVTKLDDFTTPIGSGLTGQPPRPTLNPQRAARLREELSQLSAARGAALASLVRS